MKIKTVKKLVVVGLVLILIAGAGHFGIRGYASLRQARLVKQAKEYLAQADERKALLCLQRALRYNSRDIEACRLMAELADRTGSIPAAFIWRSRLVELNPRSLNDRLALVQSAIAVRDYAAATNALEGVDAAGRQTAAYHNIAGVAALTVNQVAQAEGHFLEASRLEPTNAVPQLNLAVVRLHGSNAPTVAQARATLSGISATNSALRCQALRELLGDALRSRQTNAALALSKELVQQTNSAFSDRLLRLDVLKGSQDAEFKPALAAYQRDAGTNTANISKLGLWQMTRNGPADALVWLQTLPISTRTNQAVAPVLADCHAALQDWKGLQSAIDKQNWAELEFVRLAYKTRALRGQDLGGAAKGEWELALKAAGGQKQALMMLLRLAALWNWQTEGEEILWTIYNLDQSDPRAAQALSRVLLTNGRTRSLMSLFSQQVKRAPEDLGAKNNLAMTALLLEAPELKPHDLAREVYEKAPTNASFASTYAFSLHLQKKDAEALKVLQQLPPKALEDPSIAGYYGLVLKATGNAQKARACLDAAAKAPLLPEEKKLFEGARAKL